MNDSELIKRFYEDIESQQEDLVGGMFEPWVARDGCDRGNISTSYRVREDGRTVLNEISFMNVAHMLE